MEGWSVSVATSLSRPVGLKESVCLSIIFL